MSTVRVINGESVDVIAESDKLAVITMDFSDQQERMCDASHQEVMGPIAEAEIILRCLGSEVERESASVLKVTGFAGVLRIFEICAAQSPDIRWL